MNHGPSTAAGTTGTPAGGILVYDGDCGFCTATANLARRLLPERVDVQPWQALDLEPLGLTVEQVTTAAYFVDPDGRLHAGHAAIGRGIEAISPLLRPIGFLLRVPPLSWLAAPIYKAIANNRHRLPGSTCAIPDRRDRTDP